jgi:hypothetical protein
MIANERDEPLEFENELTMRGLAGMAGRTS